MALHLKSPLNISLTETSFFGVASLGAAQCLRDHGRQILELVQCYGGISSSAIVAAVLLTSPAKTQEYLKAVYKLVDEISPLQYGAVTPGYDLIERVRSILDEVLDEEAHQTASGRLHIKVTELLVVDKYIPVSLHHVDQGSSSCKQTKGPRYFEVDGRCWQLGEEMEISSFQSREELIEALLGAIYVPWFASWRSPKFGGKFIADVTLSRRESFPVETNFSFPEGHLVTLSPGPKGHVTMRDKLAVGWIDTSGQRFDIRSLQMFRVGNGLFPPPKDFLQTYLAEGYEDTTRFLKFYHAYEENANGLYKPRQREYANIHGINDLK